MNALRNVIPEPVVEMLLAFAKMTMASRPPDFVVGAPENPYLHRWRVQPRNDQGNCYVHLFLRDDDDRALHDHPYDNCSIPLLHGYMETLPGPLPEQPHAEDKQHARVRLPGDVIFRQAHEPHRVVIIKEPPVSLFFCGPRVRDWGFHCAKGWVRWDEFLGGNIADPNTSGGHQNRGRGCT